MKIKKSLIALITILFLSIFILPVSAAPSLSDVIDSDNGESNLESETGTSDFFDNLNVDYSQNETKVNEIQRRIHSPLSIIFQIMAYGLVVSLNGKIMIDLFFIMIPSFRFLFIKNEQNNNILNMPNIMPMQRMGGMNRMSGAIPDMSGMQTPIEYEKYKGVSEAAIKAIEESRQGKNNAVKIYLRDMIVECVMAGMLLVLTLSGVLQQIGFYIGDMLVNGIQGMI